MRGRFNEQLTELNNNLIEMGALIEKAIAQATEALERRDAEVARSVMENDDLIDSKEKEIEARCLNLLLRQQPVAHDLSQVSAILKMITDMERIGDHAADISALCLGLSGQEYIMKSESIPKMATATIRMVTGSIDAFVNRDVAGAKAIKECDALVNALFLVAKKELIALVREEAANGEWAFDLWQIAKYYERIGDHAVNIAEWVIFAITGQHKNRQIF
ncbi:MAG: phosphate signaling complex protein PhoU [Desulfobulbaceae bacterium]|jgi:phosphate transport system protein|nr:phosphate signaling complex protein PhoU [Desulfobulbaceae bacterium]